MDNPRTLEEESMTGLASAGARTAPAPKLWGLPVWSRHVGDTILESNITRRVDFALFMVAALENDELIHEAPAIVGCRTPSALAPPPDAGPATASGQR